MMFTLGTYRHKSCKDAHNIKCMMEDEELGIELIKKGFKEGYHSIRKVIKQENGTLIYKIQAPSSRTEMDSGNEMRKHFGHE
jgi:hypothetical protein